MGVYFFLKKTQQEPQKFEKNTMSTINVVPISHASAVLEWEDVLVYSDPVGNPDLYSAYPNPDIIFITHQHGDHFNTTTLSALAAKNTILVVPVSVAERLPEHLSGQTIVLANGDTTSIKGVQIMAVPS